MTRCEAVTLINRNQIMEWFQSFLPEEQNECLDGIRQETAVLRPSRPYRKFFRVASEPGDEGETYAVLVAGSNGWYNYRHQADVGHAYQTLIAHGIPAENIITMMYDDVAHSENNPYKGKLYNRPHGKDVYKGIKIDYKGDDVTPHNFLKVITGNETSAHKKPVLKTTSKDRIFIYFTDHGAVGLVSFPNEILTVSKLIRTLESMHKDKKYSQLVFYLEACESGSMFESVLRNDLDIYAITAANNHESSWGTYCENDMKLPCLGDLFSVNWLDDSDSEDLASETLEYQYELVKKKTNLSHVMHYGDLSIASEVVGLFQGEKTLEHRLRRPKSLDPSRAVNWPSRDIELNHLKSQYSRVNGVYEKSKIARRVQQIYRNRRVSKELFHELVDFYIDSPDTRRRMFQNRRSVLDMDCHHNVVHQFEASCLRFAEVPESMKYVNVLNNLCIELGQEEILGNRKLSLFCRDFDVDAALMNRRNKDLVVEEDDDDEGESPELEDDE
ncbi:unnamed protein product [Caenorhabditis auriculariae]|uniref:legumain n=1 Tax=Caenorhabditis auriculariae TaxID=2777116 RepID=A0A8S1H3Q6_9PELO|nr:unnamed protein product [Caenorhabditis auriculariae]